MINRMLIIIVPIVLFACVMVFLYKGEMTVIYRLNAIPDVVWAAIITGAFSIIIGLLTNIHSQVNHNFEMQRQRIDQLQNELIIALGKNITDTVARDTQRKDTLIKPTETNL